MGAEPAFRATSGSPAAVYAARHERCLAEERRLAAVSLRLSIARGVTFAFFLACLLLVLLAASRPLRLPLAGAGSALAVFAVLALVHDRCLRRLRRAEELRRIAGEGLARLDRDWERLPLPSEPPRDRSLPLARDLDLYGRASLFHLLGTAHTPAAKALLRDWLEGAAAPAEVRARQAAVAELAELLDFRQLLELAVRGMETGGGRAGPPDVEPFLRWAEGDPWLLARPVLLWTARGAAALTIAAFALALAPGAPVSPLLAMVILNLGLSYACRAELGAGLGRVSATRDEMMRYAAALRQAASQPFAAPRLAELTAALQATPAAPETPETPEAPETREANAAGRRGAASPPAHAALAALESRLGLADARHSAPVHFLLQVLTLWDFHVLASLEGWQRTAGRRARRWLMALGEIEALAALAALRFENPGWCLPEVAAGQPELAARDLGHPLLPAARRVGNDVTVGPAGTFLLVTGSNMSGKSTLLRAIGINAVLAQAGGPACAASLRLPPVRLATSILVEDSLAGGVSFFLAELLRIKGVVAAAAEAEARGAVLLYLLDEVLRGTNSAERQIAVRRVLRHLLARGALGAVSTHDHELATGAGIAEAARPVHFRETLTPGPDGPRMSFDYRLRPGLATTTNALELLRQVGLDLPEE
jgi:MutS-like protein